MFHIPAPLAVIVSFMVLSLHYAGAQTVPPAVQWEKSYGGSSWDYPGSIQQTSDGGYILAGITNSTDGDIFRPRGGTDGWIVKLDSTGDLAWSKTYGGSEADGLFTVDQTFDGGYIVAGVTNSKDGDLMGLSKPNDYWTPWVIKIDPSGVMQWQHLLNGSYNLSLGSGWGGWGGWGGHGGSADVHQTRDSGYIFVSTTDMDIKLRRPFEDYLFVRWDASGTIQWKATYGGSHGVWASCVRQTADGGYIAGGMTQSKDGDVSGSHDNAALPGDFWIVKIDPSGTLLWQQCLGGLDHDECVDILQTADHGYIAVGFSQSSDGEAMGNSPNDGWLVKIDSNGVLQWTRSVVAWHGGMTGICPTTDGGFAVTGGGYVSSSDPAPEVGIVKFDSRGQEQWRWYLDSASRHEEFSPFKIEQTRDGGYVLCGSTGLTANLTQSDYKIVKLGYIPIIRSTQRLSLAQTCGEQVTDTFYVHNDGNGGLEIYRLYVTNASPGLSIVSEYPLPDILPPGDSIALIVRFIPKVPGTYSLSFNIISNDPKKSSWPIDVFARKDSIGIEIRNVASDTIDFGHVHCGTSKDTTLTLVNRSTVPTVAMLQTSDSALFRLSSPSAAFPAANATQMTGVRFSGEQAPGTYVGWMIIGDSCGREQQVYFTARVDSIALLITGATDTTLCPGIPLSRRVTITNRSAGLQRITINGGGGVFSIVADTVEIASGDSASFMMQFQSTQIDSVYVVRYTIVDDCGNAHQVDSRVVVAMVAVIADALPDVTICPGDSIARDVEIHNASSQAQQVTLKGDSLFDVIPGTVNIAAGDSAPVRVLFRGSPLSGVSYTAHFALPGCAAANELTEVVHIVGPQISVPATMNMVACPFSPITIRVPVASGDSVQRTLFLSGSDCSTSVATLTLAPYQTDSITATFAGETIGTYQCTIHVTDECRVVHDVVVTITVDNAAPMQLSLRSDPAASRIGDERMVYVVGTPASGAVGQWSCTITNEPTALQFNHVASSCTIVPTIGVNTVSFALAGCPVSVSDTIATLYYQTLVGSTLAPTVTLSNVATTQPCNTVSGAGSATINLLAPGCELGTVRVYPFTSMIQSVYPNPATGTTTIAYSTIEAANVRIDVRDALGRTAQTLVNREHTPGSYSVEMDSRGMPAGLYYLVMQEGMRTRVREVSVVK